MQSIQNIKSDENASPNISGEVEQIRQKTFNPSLRELIQDIRGQEKQGQMSKAPVKRSEPEQSGFSLEQLLDMYWNNELTLFFSGELFSHDRARTQPCQSSHQNSAPGDQDLQKKMAQNLLAWQRQISDLLPHHWGGHDLMTHIMDQIWHIKKSDSEKIKIFFDIVQYTMDIVGASQLAVLAYSPFSNSYRIIYQYGLDERTKVDLAFVPGEKIVRDLVEEKQPLVFNFSEHKKDPFFRKKFSPQIWAEQHDMVILPIVSDYGDLKPKNILLVSYIRSQENILTAGPWIMDRVHYFLAQLYPIIDVLHVSGMNTELSDDIVEVVHNYFLDRRLYAITQEHRNDFQFLVIQFKIKAENIKLLRSSFYYLSVKIRDRLSHLSKVMRHSFNEGYLLLRGRDMALWPELEKIFQSHQDQVDFVVKKYPDSGFNLFNYQ